MRTIKGECPNCENTVAAIVDETSLPALGECKCGEPYVVEEVNEVLTIDFYEYEN